MAPLVKRQSVICVINVVAFFERLLFLLLNCLAMLR